MLHYLGLILHAVIYMLVSFAGDAVTSIMASVTDMCVCVCVCVCVYVCMYVLSLKFKVKLL